MIVYGMVLLLIIPMKALDLTTLQSRNSFLIEGGTRIWLDNMHPPC